MQVKKFEARTMKEALEMVKTQLGPDAIILTARDNNKSFGLVGEGSVEITAAVSEETLHKKKFVESKLRETDKEQFHKSPARAQKELIEKMVNKQLSKNQPKSFTNRKYIDIEDDTKSAQMISNNTVSALTGLVSAGISNKPMRAQRQEEEAEIKSLKQEIQSLREIIAKFQNMPQSISSAFPGSDYGLPFEVSFLFEKLVASGIAPEMCAEILDEALNSIPALKLKNKALVEGWVARYILQSISVDHGFKEKIQIFVGPPGSGKTTTLVKMASNLILHEAKKVILLTTDSLKVGASDQMRIYAQILNVPYAVIRTKEDWQQISKYLQQVDYVLVDMPGLGLKNGGELETLKKLMPPSQYKSQTHLVLSSASKDQDCTEHGKRYSLIGFQDVIFTSLDESAQHGNIYNFFRRFQVPLFAFGIGARVPEDFEYASQERVLDLIFKITQLKSQDNSEVL